jgi:hypothetical protein
MAPRSPSVRSLATKQVKAVPTRRKQKPVVEEDKTDSDAEDDKQDDSGIDSHTPMVQALADSDAESRLGEDTGLHHAVIPEQPQDALVHTTEFQCQVCKQFFPMPDKVNAGSARYPSLRDKACHAACKRLDGGAVTLAEKAELQKLKRDKVAYACKVLELIATHEKNSRQRDVCRTIFQRLIVVAKIRAQTGVAMLDEPAFMAFCKYQRNMLDTEASARWIADIANKDIPREDVDGVIYMAVPLPKRILSDRSIEQHRVVQEACGEATTPEQTRAAFDNALALAQLDLHGDMFNSVGGHMLKRGPGY